MGVHICQNCGDTIKWTGGRGKGRPPKFCSKKCKMEFAKNPKPEKDQGGGYSQTSSVCGERDAEGSQSRGVDNGVKQSIGPDKNDF